MKKEQWARLAALSEAVRPIFKVARQDLELNIASIVWRRSAGQKPGGVVEPLGVAHQLGAQGVGGQAVAIFRDVSH